MLADHAGWQIGVERQQARVDLGASDRDHGPLDAIAATHGNDIVHAKAAAGKRIRQQVSVLVPFAICKRGPPLMQGRLVAAGGGPVFEAARSRLVQALSAFRTFAARLSRMSDRET